MKFFRMDSDVWSWRVWDDVFNEVGRRDFQSAVTVWIMTYGMMCSELTHRGQEWLPINIREVAKSARISRKKAAELLQKCGNSLGFSLRICGVDAAGAPQKCEIFYPNLLKKQKISLRDGDGKFAPERTSESPTDKTRQDKREEETEKNSHDGGVNDARMRVDPEDPPPVEAEVTIADPEPPFDLVEIWNANIGEARFWTSGMFERRKAAIQVRLHEQPDPAYWVATVKRIAASDFLTGREPGRDGEHFVALDFDWLIVDDERHVAINAGRYDNERKRRRGKVQCAWCDDTGVALARSSHHGTEREFGCPSCRLGKYARVPQYSSFRDIGSDWEFVRRSSREEQNTTGDAACT